MLLRDTNVPFISQIPAVPLHNSLISREQNINLFKFSSIFPISKWSQDRGHEATGCDLFEC